MGRRRNWAGLLSGVALVSLFGAITTGLHRLLPRGIPAGSAQDYEGMLVVPARGWTYASLQTRQLLAANRRDAALGRQRVEIVCLLPGPAAAPLAAAARRAPADRDGTRRLWVRVTAEPRFATGSCMNWYAHGRRGHHWGRYLRVRAVASAAPMRDAGALADGRAPRLD